MKNTFFRFLLTLVAVGAFSSSAMAQQTVTFTPTSTVVADNVDVGGDLNDSANWIGADGVEGFPVEGDTGIINVDSSLDVGGGTLMFGAMGDLVFDGGGTLTALAAGSLTGNQGDLVGSNPSSYTFNDHTVNTADDIFAFGSVYTFNEGSTTNVGDDFQANGNAVNPGVIIINGGTHNVTDQFGGQNVQTVEVNGGTITAASFSNGAGGSFTLGGDAVLVGTGGGSQPGGFASLNTEAGTTFAIAEDWTGSWTLAGVTADDWEAFITSPAVTVGGVSIDAATFAENFVVSADGSGLSMVVEGPVLLGDVNRDGAVDFLDISPFIVLLSAGDFQAEADTNEDGVVDFLDISPFIILLSS